MLTDEGRPTIKPTSVFVQRELHEGKAPNRV